ncbi:MAG: hypothetical protein RL417_1797 [Pseudomonadota bacterium]
MTIRPRIVLIAVLSFVPCVGGADDAPRGRLADGRAYRTDDQGNQLVDYIAELEVNAEALNRRIVGLEDELAEKGRVIDRLSRGESGAAAFQGTLTERHIVGSPSEPAASGAVGELTRAKSEISRLQSEITELRRTHERTADRAGSSEGEVRALRSDLDSARRELIGVQSSLETERRLRDQDQATYAALSRECTTIRGASAEGAAREATLRDEVARARDAYTVDLEAVRRERDELRGELQRVSADLNKVQAVLSATQSDLAGARSALAAAELSTSRSPVHSPAVTTVVAQRPIAGREYASRSRSAVVDSIRGSMLTDLNQVRSLVVTRDNLFQGAVGRGDQQLQIKPSPLVSAKRRTLNDIAAGIKSAQQVHELTALRSDLSEIRALVQGDIDLLRRTGRAG